MLPKIVTSHRAMSYVTPHLSITGTCTPSLTRTTSLSSDPLLGELQPCADLRQLERGSLVELHPSQCVDRMVALGGYALPSGPSHVHVDWTWNCTKFTPRHACRCAYKCGLGARIGPQSKDSIWNRFMELWSRAASFVTPWC